MYIICCFSFYFDVKYVVKYCKTFIYKQEHLVKSLSCIYTCLKYTRNYINIG